jgi:hypothetical protein
MAKLLMDYTILDQEYENGEFRYFSGNSGAPGNVDLPQSVSPNFMASTDYDPVVRSYMGLDGQPRILACIVTTSGGTSTGKYFLYKADLTGGSITWSLLSSPSGFTLNTRAGAVAGNPYGVVRAGNFLYINDYDTTNIYRLNISSFETAVGGGAATYTVNDTTDVAPDFPDPTVLPTYTPHGAALIALTDNGVTYLYSLYAFVDPNSPLLPKQYAPSAVNKFTVNATSGALTTNGGVSVGKNAMALVPVAVPVGGINILVPAIGGPQRAAFTNGEDSTLYRVNTSGTLHATLMLKGDGGAPTPTYPAITVAGNYDIKSVAVSPTGDVWLLLVTNDANYKSWWRLYKTDIATLVGYTDPKTIAAAVSNGDLSPLDAGLGSPGYYWDILYENAGGSGRLWFVQGTPIRVSARDDYHNKLLFDEGVLYEPDPSEILYAVNLNSADLIGEMIYQYEQGHSIDTRLIKGRGVSRAAAAEEEEEEEEK